MKALSIILVLWAVVETFTGLYRYLTSDTETEGGRQRRAIAKADFMRGLCITLAAVAVRALNYLDSVIP